MDTLSKKLFFLTFIFSTVAFSWLNIFKKIILLPFKLGIFSFIYSILGFDVSWFLNLFNFFTLNIPFWIYLQYLNLYNNWLSWWNRIVNIKSLTTVPVREIKNTFQAKKDLIELEKSNNNKVWFVVGGILIVGGIIFGLWYLDYFSFNNSRPGNNPDSPTGSIRFSITLF
jgi:hypothetical protein